MRRFLGQATTVSMIVSHKVLSVLFGFGLLCVVLLAALAWRLSQGPVDLGFSTGWIEASVNTEGAPTRINIGGIALAWEGFNRGLDRPVDLRLRDIAVVDNTGHKRMEIPRAAVTISARGLLRGRILPSAMELDGVRLTVLRGADGMVSVDVGTLSEAANPPREGAMSFDVLLAELMRPPGDDQVAGGQILSQLRRVRLSDFAVSLRDERLGVAWEAPKAMIDLVRRTGGGIDLNGDAALLLGDQKAHLTLSAKSSGNPSTILTQVGITPVNPAALAVSAPGLAGLAALDAPVSVQAELTLSPTLVPGAGTLKLEIGVGSLRMRSGTVPLRSASLNASGAMDKLVIDTARMVLPGAEGEPDTVATVTGSVLPGAARLTAALTIAVDRVSLADLPRFWPAGLGGGARPWIVENMTVGVVKNGHADIALDANADLSDVRLLKATGSLDGEDLTVHWLRPVPPGEQIRGRLRIVDPDTLDITLITGRQHIGAQAPIVLTGGSMRVTGMSAKDQDAEIAVQTTSSLADAIALLKEPKLKLLSTHPFDLREPTGTAAVSVKIKLPLDSKVAIEDVDIAVTAQLKQIHLTAVAAGRDLDQTDLELTADKKMLTLKGQGQIAGIPAQIDGMMDFQAGKPRDVQQRITVSGKPSAQQLTAAGLDSGDMLAGEIPLKAIWSKQTGGEGDMIVEADLTPATALVPPLAWRKPAGAAAKASLRLLLSKDRLVGIGSILAEGAGVSVRGSAEAVAGTVTALRLDRVTLARTDVSGTIRLPPRGPIAVELNGAALDLSAKLAEKTPRRDKSKPEPPPGPAWTLTGTFAHVLLANEKTANNVRARASNDGRVFRDLAVTGVTGPGGPFSIDIGMDRGIRRMDVRTADAGAFLKGLDAVHTFEGGRLNLAGTFDDSDPGHPLSGSLDVTDFRVRGAPALGKLLQAMTLYGLVDVVSGPGLGFARLTSPFVYQDDDLELKDARAFSASLGITAKGHLDLKAEQLNVEGTIVPAYFFNSLLGRIPFVGGLFSPEKDGGLFAARYTIRGPVGDPTVFVNPLSMLTPGFLRGLFGVF